MVNSPTLKVFVPAPKAPEDAPPQLATIRRNGHPLIGIERLTPTMAFGLPASLTGHGSDRYCHQTDAFH